MPQSLLFVIKHYFYLCARIRPNDDADSPPPHLPSSSCPLVHGVHHGRLTSRTAADTMSPLSARPLLLLLVCLSLPLYAVEKVRNRGYRKDPDADKVRSVIITRE